MKAVKDVAVSEVLGAEAVYFNCFICSSELKLRTGIKLQRLYLRYFWSIP